MRRATSSKLVAAAAKSITRPGCQRMFVPDRTEAHATCLDNRRQYSVTRRNESLLIAGGLGVVVAAASAQYVVGAYNSYVEKKAAEQPASNTSSDPKEQTTEDGKDKSTSQKADPTTAAKEESPFAFTSTWFAKTFYDGGFEDKMTKREAALILGIRESATVDRIKEAYRKLLPLNHPDRGGSAYIATKINEAKDLLLKGK